MFPIQAKHVKRVSFASKLFPRINSSLNLDTSKLTAVDKFDGEVFCGGRSKNKDLLTLFGCLTDTQRGGVSAFVQMPLLRRSIKKLTNLIESELELVGAHEVLMPTLIPQNLWHKSNRIKRQNDALNHVYCFKDHANNELLLAPTYEESMTQLVKDMDQVQERDLPLLLYQTSHKFRFEPNPRFGLLRCNEFLMNDTYSFDTSLDAAKSTYEKISNVYDRIFDRLQLKCLKFESGTGNIGGKYSHEYQLVVSSGEDNVVQCKSCNYAYTEEMCTETGSNFSSNQCVKCNSSDILRLRTLELAHTFLLSDTYSKPMRAQFKLNNGTKVHYEMGCYGIGLTRIIGAGLDLNSIVPRQDSPHSSIIQMRWPSEVEPFKVAIVAPAKRSKQHHGGSTDFIEKFVTNILNSTQTETDILVEDRDKDGIYVRLTKLQSLGIPNIIVVGQRFLNEQPEVELVKLDADKVNYEKCWLTEEQACDYIKNI